MDNAYREFILFRCKEAIENSGLSLNQKYYEDEEFRENLIQCYISGFSDGFKIKQNKK